MALNAEKLKGSAALAALTDEQTAAIAELSTNDENAVLAQRIGEIHGQYDRDIEAVTGLKRPEGVKTYEWMKADVLPKVQQATKLQGKLDALKTEKEQLETQLKDGKIDEATAKRLQDLEKLKTDLQAKIEADKTDYDTKLAAAQKANTDITLSNEFDRALVGKKFKDESIISKAVRESFVSNAKAAVLAENTPDWIDDGQGGKRLVFRGADGEIKRNAENNLNPYTAEELFVSKIGDVLDLGKQQPGGGTGAPAGGGAGGSALSLSSAKTQVEADELATDYLMSKGLTRGSSEYNEEFTKIRTENEVEKLPLR